MAALRAHATQIAVDGPFFALSNNVGNEVWGTEFFRLAKGRPARSTSRGWRRTCSPASEPAVRRPTAAAGCLTIGP